MKMKRIISFLLCAAMLFSGAAVLAEEYTGTANGMGPVTVTLTVEDGRITSALVDTSNETAGYGLELADELAEQIVTAQNAQIDGVSGATITSTAVKVATDAAMQAAGLTSANAGSMIPGVYVGSAHGSKSTIRMAVEVSEDKILHVWNVENGDTRVASERAVETVAREIVEKQSLAVDVLSGATLSSQGAIRATANALEQAGANVNALYASEPVEIKQGETEEVDILIVGAGASGIAAAMAAKYDDELSAKESGLNILVVERNDFAGGDVGFSGGFVASFRGTPINDAMGISIDDFDAYFEAYKAAYPQMAELMNENVFRKVYEYSPTVLNGLMARGLYLNMQDAQSLTLLGGIGWPYAVGVTADRNTGVRSYDYGYMSTYGSPYLAESLQRMAEDAGVTIRYGTHADSLIVENGTCLGVNVTGPESTYAIHAKKIILCTGYASTDPETVRLFFPQFEGVVRNNSAGNLGEAAKWIHELGGEVSIADSDVFFGLDGVLGFFGAECSVTRANNVPWVDVNGHRFMDESGAHDTQTVLALDGHHAFVIFDSTSPYTEYYDVLSGQGMAFRADTIEDLGKASGIDATTLASTIDQYNADAAAKEGDSLFGTAAENMTPVLKAPFYAMQVNVINLDTNLGVFVDDDMTVLMSKNGERIENLYAAGGAVGNSLPNQSTGFHIMSALTSGAYAGSCARDAALMQ